jgi:signal transduction histidine kinase
MTADGLSPPPPPERAGRRARAARFLGSARTRIVAWFLLLLAVTGLLSLLAARQALLARLDQELDAALTQEAEELRALAEGRDPADGQPFGTRVDRIFDVFLSRNIPNAGETFLTFVDGRVYRPEYGGPLTRPGQDPGVVTALAATTAPTRGSLETREGERVEYLAIPLEADGEVAGVFAVLAHRAPLVARIDEVTRVFLGVGLGVLLIASSIVWAVAGRILAPVREVTHAARSISDTDLSRRIEVHGNDEVAELTRTFNAMLDRLESAFTSQRDFVNDAGHELRTPITIVRGHLELLGDDPAELAETTPLLLDELDRMSRFVDDLLVLAKAQRPDFLRLETVDVAELTEELSSKARHLADRDWRQEGVGRALMVADRQRVTQAMMQLAANAAQHTADGATIALGSAVADGEVRFWVRDTGEGVPYEEQERIFDRFARVERPRGASTGAGLGLAIVRAIAQAHHGRVELRSRPDAGATFTLVLPIDQPSRGEGVS